MFDSVAAMMVIAGSTWFTVVPEGTKEQKETVSVSYMTDIRNTEKDFSLTKGKSVVDVAYYSAPMSFHQLRWGVSGMYDAQGTYMFGPGIGKTVDYGKFSTTLFIYPSYSSVHGVDRNSISGSMNFRSTFDVTYRVDPTLKIGVGLMHISNGGYKDPNHGLEAFRITVNRDF